MGLKVCSDFLLDIYACKSAAKMVWHTSSTPGIWPVGNVLCPLQRIYAAQNISFLMLLLIQVHYHEWAAWWSNQLQITSSGWGSDHFGGQFDCFIRKLNSRASFWAHPICGYPGDPASYWLASISWLIYVTNCTYTYSYKDNKGVYTFSYWPLAIPI